MAYPTGSAGADSVVVRVREHFPDDAQHLDGADRTKFDGIESGATADMTTEEIQDLAAPLLDHANHTNITATYNDASNRVELTAVATVAQNTQTGTTYTLVLADAGKVVEMNNASSNTLTVPPTHL